ncbi:hypothetical protein PCE1_002308 [Barthelona sp. PCE]
MKRTKKKKQISLRTNLSDTLEGNVSISTRKRTVDTRFHVLQNRNQPKKASNGQEDIFGHFQTTQHDQKPSQSMLVSNHRRTDVMTKPFRELSHRDITNLKERFKIISNCTDVGVLRTWSDLEVDNHIISVVKSLFQHPFTVQRQALPVMLNKKHNLLCYAPTGHGKSLCFLLPALQRSMTGNAQLHTLIVVQTHELAQQLVQHYIDLSPRRAPEIACVIGGVQREVQARALDSARIVVGTPGRLVDFVQNFLLDLTPVSCFIVDEADKTISANEEDLTFLIEKLQKNIKMGFFSATSNREEYDRITSICESYDRPLAIVRDGDFGVVSTVTQEIVISKDASEKEMQFISLVQRIDPPFVVFCRTRRITERIELLLEQVKSPLKYSVIHGGLSQLQREGVVERFKMGAYDGLITTNLLSRGIDIRGIMTVVNFNMPEDIETYIHRLGRTGRAGEQGASVSFVSKDDKTIIPELMTELKKRRQFSVVSRLRSLL